MNELFGIIKEQILNLSKELLISFDFLRALFNVNVDEKVYFFTQTLLNTFQNFIPHETIICHDRDTSWVN